MAQRTGADDFLAPKATAASSRILLALAASAALLLGGCGGGGDSQEQGSTTATATQQESSAGPDGASRATGESPSGSKSQGSGTAGVGKAGGGSGALSQSGGQPGGGEVPLPTKGREQEASATEEAQATVADITLSSPDLELQNSVFAIPATYTCDGKGSWPTLEWGAVPGATEELLIFVMNVQPVGGRLFFDWAAAGIDPSLERIEAGKLPPGAVQGQNSAGKRGYEICPTEGKSETYVFTLYAIPTKLSPQQGFDPHRLREEALGARGSAGILAAAYGGNRLENTAQQSLTIERSAW